MKRRISHIVFNYWEFILLSFLLGILILISSGNIFFWDTVQLGARHATFYYDNNLKLEFLPNNIDSGHIPTFGYLLACLWKVFGKTLLVSHLYILPFAIGIVWQLQRIITHFFTRRNWIWVMLIVLLDTTFLSQVSLVSPDIPLLFFFLYGLNTILKSNRLGIAIAFSCLFLISMRGMILTVPLFIFDLYLNGKFDLKKVKSSLINLIRLGLPYIPAALIFVGFSFLHYTEKGWIGYHEDSPWAIFFERVGFQGAVKNAMIFGWRLLDFGRVFIWFMFFFSVLWIYKNKTKMTGKGRKLGVLFLLILFFLSIPAIIYFDLKGHRYFMPIYFAFSFLVSYLVLEIISNKTIKKILLGIGLIGLISGSFWVYPKTIAQGWDSTLAHLPYYKLRDKMINFIEENKIPKHEIGFDFPGGYEQRFLDLSDSTWSFPEVDFDSQQYILYASVVNEFSDEELLELENNWFPIHKESSMTVELILYQNRK